MKKFFAMLPALLLLLSPAACGGDEAGKSVEEVFGSDPESTEEQPMSEEREERDVIYAAVKDHFGDVTFFSDTEFAKMTYDDLKELIGVDAGHYYYDADSSAQTFVREAGDCEYAKQAFCFRFDELYALGFGNMNG